MHDESNVGRWLLLLRDGAEAEQQLARTELGLILEARGLLDEAAEAFERNVAEGTTDRRPYERLAAIARLRGDTAAEARALRALAELLSPTPLPEPETQNAEPRPDLTPPAPLSGAERGETQEVVVEAEYDGEGAEEFAVGAVADGDAPEPVAELAVADGDVAAADTDEDGPAVADELVVDDASVQARPDELPGESGTQRAAEAPEVDDPRAADEETLPEDALVDPGAPAPSDQPPAASDEAVSDADAADAEAESASQAAEIADAAPSADDAEPASVAAAAVDQPASQTAAPASDSGPDAPADEPATAIAAPDSLPAMLLSGALLPELPPPPSLPLPTLSPPVADNPDLAAPISSLSAPTRGSAEGEGMSAKPIFAPSMGRSSGQRGAGGVRSLSTPPPTRQPALFRLLATLIGLVVVAVVVGGALMVPVSRPLTVAPAKPALSPTAPERQPAAVPTPLLPPSPSPSPSPSPTMSAAQAPAPSPTVPAAPLAARCTDAALRFPESRESAAAVRTAFREHMARQGVTIDPASTLFAGLAEAHAARHAEVLAGWMAVTLQRERRGLPTFPLVDYVASDIIVAAGPGEYQLRATISPQGWSELRALSPDSCEGAFLNSPENARWVELMQASVGDITWALPTPQPRR